MAKAHGDYIDRLAQSMGIADKVTRWFPAATAKPARVGWYEVESVGWQCKRMYWVAFGGWHVWVPSRHGDGLVHLGRYKGDRWRGLAQPYPDYGVWQAYEARHSRVGFTQVIDFSFAEFRAGWEAHKALVSYG